MADYPEDRNYTSDHEWVTSGNDAIVRVGITTYATAALGDIVFVSLPEVGDDVEAGDSVAELESTKSVSEVFSPVSGTIVQVNEAVGDSPELINDDPYDAGWLFEVRMSDPEQFDDLLDVTAYTDQLQ